MKKIIYTLLLSVFIQSCGNPDSKLFTLLDKGETGIDFRNILDESPDMNVLNYSYFYNGGGVAVGDINNDGLQDIVFTGNMVKNRMFLNKGDLRFEDITVKSGIAANEGWCTGVTMVDINNDGHLDIYISRSADVDPERRKNLLFINNGDLTFTEKAEEYGLADSGYSTQAAFFDYDKDGDLDMFLINHSLQEYSTGAQENPELRNRTNPDFANKLFRNEDGRFRDVSAEAGITSNVLTFGLGLAVSDVNNDGWPDIHVSNDFNEPDYLFINNGNGTFTDKLYESMDQISMYSMGSDFADFNNDGLPDLITLDMLPEDNYTQKMHSGAENFDKMQHLFNKGFFYQFSRNMLQKNNGDGTFSEIGQFAGVSNTDWSWAALFSDFDNDGFKDLFISNGYVKDYTDMDFLKYTMDRTIRARRDGQNVVVAEFIEKMPTIEIPNYIFQNTGSGSFVQKTADWGLNQKGVSTGAVYADLDNDGDMDLVVSNINGYASVYKNNADKLSSNNYIRIKLEGSSKNSQGIGARVTVYSQGNRYYQEQMPVRGFQSAVDPVLNFGIGKADKIDSVRIIWPDDRSQTVRNAGINQTLNLKYSDSDSPGGSLIMTPVRFVQPVNDILFKHTENNFNDFNVQGLLPNYLSRQGPCMASADVNGDGLQDLFIGGAAGQPGAVYIQQRDGSFIYKTSADILADLHSEDTAAEFADVDGDGDPDLYVASGGYEFNENDPLLQDRLYINDGNGNFVRKKSALPGFYGSTGVVRAADIDGDHDLDLFVGGRVIPGKYPETPLSKIYINDGKGNFTDATSRLAPALEKIGMVTDALWVDLDGDKLKDLIVVGEWMPVKVLMNEKGSLADRSDRYIHFASSGWWNVIYAEDMDDDGDPDIIIGNQGLNAQFRASEKEPLTIHYKDFDGNGSIDPILSYYINGVSYPALSRDDITEQLPMLKSKYTDYSSYANATIQDLFTPENFKDAQMLKAEILASIYLENRGAEGFKMHLLPDEAQYAPIFAIGVLDIDNDKKKDLVLAGNNSWTRIKFGHFSASYGTVLRGDGSGGFSYMPQPESGINVRGNVRSLRIIPGKPGSSRIIFGLNNAPVRSFLKQ